MACVGEGEVHSQRPLPSSKRVQQPKLNRENVAKGDDEVLKQLALDMESILTKVHNNKGLLNQLAKKQPPKASRPSQAEIRAARVYSTKCFFVALLIFVPLLAFSIAEVIGKEDYWRSYGPISIGLLIHAMLVKYLSHSVRCNKLRAVIYALAYGTFVPVFVPLKCLELTK